jgi:hypothetical protein
VQLARYLIVLCDERRLALERRFLKNHGPNKAGNVSLPAFVTALLDSSDGAITGKDLNGRVFA